MAVVAVCDEVYAVAARGRLDGVFGLLDDQIAVRGVLGLLEVRRPRRPAPRSPTDLERIQQQNMNG